MSMLRRLFALVTRKAARITGQKSPGPLKGAPDAQEDDLRFIAAAMGRGKWADAVFYGPGAAEAEGRRRASLGLDAKPAQDKTPERAKNSHKRKRMSLRERLAGLRQMRG